jgi:hypothetical protein
MQSIEIVIPDLSTHPLTGDGKASSTPSELGSSSGSTAEPTELRRSNQTGTDAEPDSEPKSNLYGVDAKREEITLQERGLVIETVRTGEKNINTILFKVWGVKQGGSKGYAISRKKLDQILKDAGIELK